MKEKDNQDDQLSLRIAQALETRLESDRETLEALKDLSTFFTENTFETRRNLLTEIDKRSLTINEEFLAAFREVKLAVDEVCTEIDAITASVTTMKNRLKETEEQTHELINQTNALQEESQKLQIHQKIASAFLSRFQLTSGEHQTLYGASRDTPITKEFFVVLDRIQAIHADCRVLMQSGFQTCALDIMEEMTQHQETGLERLYRWTQSHCRNVDGGEVGALVVQAMSRLQERPVLFKYVVDEYSTSRRSLLVRNFIDALTVGGPGGNPRPIEMSAQDPKRYVGDMLAWLHAAIPGEKENLLSLLRACDKIDLTDYVQAALANLSDGVCHPLRVRVEMILNSEKSAVTLYGVANLIRFYQGVINSVIRGGQLELCLSELQTSSEQAYLSALAYQVRTALQPQNAEAPQGDLQPPACVGRLLAQLKDLLSVASMVEGRQADIAKMVATVIDPLLTAVTEAAAHLSTTDMAVFLLNCLYEMQTALAMYEYMEERMERLQAQCDAQIDTLTSEQASSLVTNLNLSSIYTVLQSEGENFDLNNLRAFRNKLEQFLEMPDILILPQVGLLVSGTHRTTVQQRAFNVIVAIYRQLHERVMKPESGFEKAEEIFTRTPDEVEKMLDC